MDAHEKKILEYKRKVISLMRSREHASALKLYHRSFSAECPADPEFLDSFFIELNKVNIIDDEVIRSMIDEELVFAHRGRALSPDHPTMRGTAQNPDVYFQAREACNPFYNAVPGIVEEYMERFAKLTGRQYKLFDYICHPQAERVIVSMG